MKTLSRCALVTLVAIALLSIVPGLGSPLGGYSSPYVSALTGGVVNTRPQCPNKGCVSPTKCGHVEGAFGCTTTSGTCEAGICR